MIWKIWYLLKKSLPKFLQKPFLNNKGILNAMDLVSLKVKVIIMDSHWIFKNEKCLDLVLYNYYTKEFPVSELIIKILIESWECFIWDKIEFQILNKKKFIN